MKKDNELVTQCPYCDCINEMHETVEGHKNPSDGDISMCIKCSEVSEFKNNNLVEVDFNTLDEKVRLEIKVLRDAWLKVKTRIRWIKKDE